MWAHCHIYLETSHEMANWLLFTCSIIFLAKKSTLLGAGSPPFKPESILRLSLWVILAPRFRNCAETILTILTIPTPRSLPLSRIETQTTQIHDASISIEKPDPANDSADQYGQHQSPTWSDCSIHLIRCDLQTLPNCTVIEIAYVFLAHLRIPKDENKTPLPQPVFGTTFKTRKTLEQHKTTSISHLFFYHPETPKVVELNYRDHQQIEQWIINEYYLL